MDFSIFWKHKCSTKTGIRQSAINSQTFLNPNKAGLFEGGFLFIFQEVLI